MKRKRKGQVLQDFSGPLWDNPQPQPSEIQALQELLGSSCKNPDEFHRTWVDPLLAEGLNIGRVLDLLLNGKVLPN